MRERVKQKEMDLDTKAKWGSTELHLKSFPIRQDFRKFFNG